jgi:bifunctional UDP-N-acetylglucosamine pyrophosphorylase / glucosamine-1-phosphate N-acetyltransferase
VGAFGEESTFRPAHAPAGRGAHVRPGAMPHAAWPTIRGVNPAPTVLILAAGQGTRMRSRTSKGLHELCGVPMALWPVRAALAAGAGRVVVVDSPERALEQALPEGVGLAIQPEPNGTGGAVLAALEALDGAGNGDGRDGEPLVVLSGDVPLVSAAAIGELLRAHEESGAQATLASAVLQDPSGYGRVVRDERGAVMKVVETKEAGDATPEQLQIREVNAGVYVFAPGALRAALPRLSADNAQRELYLPRVLDLIRSDGGAVAAHALADPQLLLGVNDRAALAQVRALAQAAIHAAHMAAGVTIVDPAATVIDLDVQIGQDTTIEPFTTIRGRTRIGERCVVRHSYLCDCLLEDGVTVGPFAYLRPNSVLREGAKAGTFVEIKNSDVGARSKIPHLSYIGDAHVGEDTNLGASTITANYDGRAKHPTTIGSGVRGGVDTSLVAPVTVGDGAVIAAGSVITEDVPPGALAVARAGQRNVEGYAERDAEHAGEAAPAPAGAQPRSGSS